MTPKEKHEQAVQLYTRGDFDEAARLLSEALREEETSERWNDWATVQLAVQRPGKAEQGYRRALALAPQNHQAEINLGVLLAHLDRSLQAIPFLEKGIAVLKGSERAAVEQLLNECRRPAADAPSSLPTPSETRSKLSDYLRGHVAKLGSPRNAASTPAGPETEAGAAVTSLPAQPRNFAEAERQRGLHLFQQGQYEEAVRSLGQALGEAETSERWNDWAAAQWACQRPGEAEVGFRRALGLEAESVETATNLAALLGSQGRGEEAIPYLELSARDLDERQRADISRIVQDFRAKRAATGAPDTAQLGAYLDQFVGQDANEQAYYRVHRHRFLATLDFLPPAAPGQQLLELGAAYHHLTVAIKRWKGYAQIRCADIWEGEPACTRQLRSLDGREEHAFVVDNFDLEKAPWPYADSCFDVVMCCEMLEHLISDPMLVLAEINRVLKPSGLLLLTTPNLASAKSVEYVLQGDSPYIYGQYEPGGRPTDRHNREYTPGELRCLVTAAGFGITRLATRDFYWSSAQPVLRRLAALGCSVAERGDTTLLLARKHGPVRERHPAEFYALGGTQTRRRELQTGNAPGPVRVLVVHEILPEYDRTGCDQRLMQVLRSLRAQGHAVTYLARNGVHRERYLSPLEELGIKVYAHDAERLRFLGVDAEPTWDLKKVLTEGRFDLAILYHWYWAAVSVPEHYLGAIRRLSPQTRIAVLTDDQHGTREMRLAELSKQWPDWEHANDYLERELEIYREADLVLTVSEEDRLGLLAREPSLATEILPNDAESLAEVEPGPAGTSFAAREGLLFLGNFDNHANRDAINWFFERVWDEVRRRLPGTRLYLAGSNLPVDFAVQVPDVMNIGYVQDLGPLFARHRLLVAPVRYGTGTKTKILNALAHGLPVVTSTIGAEGLSLQHAKHALIADPPEAFAEAVVRAYQDEILWGKLAAEGRQHVRQQFSRERLEQQIAHIIELAQRLALRSVTEPPTPSFLLVEQHYPETLRHLPARERAELRLLGYARLAEYFLAEDQHAEAARQLRHIFSFMRGNPPRTEFFALLLERMERCYHELGEERGAIWCREAAACILPQLTVTPPTSRAPATKAKLSHRQLRRQRQKRPKLSVIIPTYNRRAELEACLEALGRQTLAPDKFEVVVVDDGSTDGTEAFCRGFSSAATFVYARQANAGPGAARRLGVERARGDYLLLLNDDSIAEPDLLAEHLRVQRAHAHERCVVLGDFRYPPAARQRALTYFLSSQPFLFPQVSLNAGRHDKNAYFIASNLSVRRDAVLAVGSFDPCFRVAEDTELGVRLKQVGYQVLYHPSARAWHEHLSFSTADLIRRARAYGETELRLLRKHPHLMGDGTGPFGRLDEAATQRIREQVERQCHQIAETARALERFDNVDFAPFFTRPAGGRTAAAEVMELFSQAVPAVFWFYICEALLEAWDKEQRTLAPTFAPANCRPEVRA